MPPMEDSSLLELMRKIDAGARADAIRLLRSTPPLATARLAQGGTRTTSEEFFLPICRLQLYVGDTALHVAAAAYDIELVRELLAAGAAIAAQNRRGAQPIHAAANGAPGSNSWNPAAHEAVVKVLVAAGADPNAAAAGGVTPLHRAVRNRCSAAVRALLDAGADPFRKNDAGSTAGMLAIWTTGRGGSGTSEAKAEQAHIARMLAER